MNDVKLRLDYFLTKCKLANGDVYTSTRGKDIIVGKGLLDASSANARCSSDSERFITSFAPRKNTGVQPVCSSLPVVTYWSDGDEVYNPVYGISWDFELEEVNCIEWKPDLDALIKMQIEHDKNQAEVLSANKKHSVNFDNFEDEFSKVGLAAKNKQCGYSITKCDSHYSVTFNGEVVESGFNYIREAQERADELNDSAELDAAKERQVNELVDFIREHGNHTDITVMAKLMQKRGLLAEILLPLEK